MIVILFLSLVEINSIYFCKYKKTLEIFLNQQLTKFNFQPSSMSINELRVNYIRCESENNLIIKYLPRKNMLTYKSSILEKTCDYREIPKCNPVSLKEFDTIC